MSNINWKKPIEYLNGGTRWVPARLVVTNVHNGTYEIYQNHPYGILYRDSYYGEQFARLTEEGKYNGYTYIRNTVKKVKLHGAVLRGDRVDEDSRSYVNAPELLPSEAEIKKLYPNAVGYFSKEIIENDDA